MKDIAISVRNLVKRFRIPHERITTVRGAFVNAFRKKSYEEFLALDDVSFTVNKGDFFGIIGRNGSGKSTLLKILAGIYHANSGSVRINGRISPFLELGIGFNPELSGRDNIFLNATVLGLTKKQIQEKFDAIVDFSELERFIDQKIKNYSSGMQVRLAFSVAIHANRDILLMDEVLAVGDTNFQQKCIEQFNEYRNLGKTVILVSHDLATVQRYCDAAMLLRNGKIEKIGDPDNVVSLYLRQNMSDEEKRLHDEQSSTRTVKTDTGLGKIAEITSVEFFNKHGERRKVFRSGDDITARIHYVARRRITKPVFGVAVHTEDGIHISGPNTKTSQFSIEAIEGKGYIEFVITKNPFFAGSFDFTAALFDWDCITPFDYHDKKYRFKIISHKMNQYGIIELPHLWGMKQ